ncbi:MAG TPA: ATP-binding protein, partial [Anaerolineaceae bacterium]|nr:ATP-binding protein [Anaerolineaceae bacterium]
MNIQEFQAILQTRCAIDLKKPVLLGFSGGPDSICLLSLLVKSGVEVTAAHLDHALRPDSAAEAVQAEEICRQLGADFISRRVDVADYAQKK